MANDIGKAKKYFLQTFRNDKETISRSFNNVKPFPEEELREIIKEISPLFESVKIR